MKFLRLPVTSQMLQHYTSGKEKCQKKSSNCFFTTVSRCFSVMYGVVLCGIPFNASIWQAPCAHNASGKLLLTPSSINYIGCWYMFVYTYLYVCACILKKKNLNVLLFNFGFMKKRKTKKLTASLLCLIKWYLLPAYCLLTASTVRSWTVVKRLWKQLASVIVSS